MNFDELENIKGNILNNIKSLNDNLSKLDNDKVKPMKESLKVLNTCLGDLKNPDNINKLMQQNQKMISMLKMKITKS